MTKKDTPQPSDCAGKEDLTLSQLKNEPGEFSQSVCKQLAAMGISVDVSSDDGFRLVLDDRRITNKQDISSSNGRYFFETEWEECYIPHADSPGVYFFFGKNDVALYVGKSEVGIGKRIGEHVSLIKSRRASDPNSFADVKGGYVVTIPFDVAPCLGVAFESYLLSKYSLEWNTALNKPQKLSH